MERAQDIKVLLLTTYDLSEKRQWNLEIHDELLARGAKASYASWRDSLLTVDVICGYSHVVFLTCFYYNEHIEDFYRFIAAKLEGAKRQKPDLKIINDVEIILWNSNKTYLKELLDVGFLLPATDFVPANNSLEAISHALLQRESNSPVVVKPSVSAGDAGTHLIRHPHNLTPADKYFLAQVVDQPALSCLMLQDYHAAIKIPSGDDFRANSQYGGTVKTLPKNEVPESALKVGNDIWKFVRDKFLERKLFGEGSDLVYARVDGVLDDTGNFILMKSSSSNLVWGLATGIKGRQL